MKRLPKLYNSSVDDVVLKLTSRRTKKGDVFFCVEFNDDYATFNHLSSALDFINSNFSM